MYQISTSLFALTVFVCSIAFSSGEPALSSKLISLKSDVMPILQARCGKCHLNGKTRSNLSLETFEGIQKGGKRGMILNKEKPLESTMWLKISSENPPFGERMPLSQEPLPESELKVIKEWIMVGAPNN